MALKLERLTEAIIGAGVEVHKALGPSLLESIYEECLCHELHLRGLQFERQLSVPITYKGVQLQSACRLDVVVEGKVVIEIKAVENVLPVHEAQILSYMRLGGYGVGLLLNFDVPVLKDGITRMVL